MTESFPAFPQLALSTSAFESLALQEALPRIAELGFTAVELVADQPHLFPGSWTLGQAMRLGRALDSEGLSVVNLACETGRGFFTPIPAGPIYEPSMITPAPAGRRLRLQHQRRCLDLAFALGAPCITVASGVCLPGVTPAVAWEYLQDGLSVLLSHAEELGVLVAIAPRPGHLVSRIEDVLSLTESLPHPLLGVTLDLAQLSLQDEPYQAAILSCSDRLWTVQVTDVKLPSPYRLRPGLGDVELPDMLEVLQAVGYAGPLTLHLENYPDTPEQAAQEALQFMHHQLTRSLLPV